MNLETMSKIIQAYRGVVGHTELDDPSSRFTNITHATFQHAYSAACFAMDDRENVTVILDNPIISLYDAVSVTVHWS